MRIIQCDRCHARIPEDKFPGAVFVEITVGSQGALAWASQAKDLCKGCHADLETKIAAHLEPLPLKVPG